MICSSFSSGESGARWHVDFIRFILLPLLVREQE
jgi:hypothetical protein